MLLNKQCRMSVGIVLLGKFPNGALLRLVSLRVESSNQRVQSALQYSLAALVAYRTEYRPNSAGERRST